MRALRRTTALLAAGALALTTGAGAAFADLVKNSVSADGVVNIVAGGSTTVRYQIQAENEQTDGQRGCNAADGSPATLSITAPAAVSMDKSTLTFGQCGQPQSIVFSAHTVGRYAVTVTVNDGGTGSYTTEGANFILDVSPRSTQNAAPSVSVSGVLAGESYVKGTVPSAGCEVADAEDGPSSFAATLSAVTGPHATDGIGEQTATCSYTDAGGLTATASVTYLLVDPSPPTVSYTLTPSSPDGDNGWYRSDVSLRWAVSEKESPGSLSTTGCVDQDITSDQTATEYRCSATSAGGTAAEVAVTIKRDATPPTVTDDGPVAEPTGTNGWYQSPVTNRFVASDATSGLAEGQPSVLEASTGTAEGTGLTVASGPVADQAGNTNPGISSGPFNVDLTPPVDVTFIGGPAEGSRPYFGAVPPAPTCTAVDTVSGVASCVVTGYSTAVGTHTLTATATDNAGHTSTAKLSYEVLAWTFSGLYQPVDMGNVLNTVRAGSTVPLKFEIFAGPTELTDTAAVKSLVAVLSLCDGAAVEDPVELTATGATVLRYDVTAGQFVYNWQTPKKPGSCYRVTITDQSGSFATALFKLK